MEEYEQLLINAILISKLIVNELNGDNSYKNILRVADDLKLTPYQVNQFVKLYEHVQTMMLI